MNVQAPASILQSDTASLSTGKPEVHLHRYTPYQLAVALQEAAEKFIYCNVVKNCEEAFDSSCDIRSAAEQVVAKAPASNFAELKQKMLGGIQYVDESCDNKTLLHLYEALSDLEVLLGEPRQERGDMRLTFNEAVGNVYKEIDRHTSKWEFQDDKQYGERLFMLKCALRRLAEAYAS